MKLSKNNWLVKLTFFDDWFFSGKDKPFNPPKQMTLCQMTGRITFLIPFFCGFIAVITAVYALIVLPSEYFGGRFDRWYSKSLLKAAIKDFKNKTCTKIDIE